MKRWRFKRGSSYQQAIMHTAASVSFRQAASLAAALGGKLAGHGDAEQATRYTVESMFSMAHALAAFARGPQPIYTLQRRKRWGGAITMVRLGSRRGKPTHAP